MLRRYAPLRPSKGTQWPAAEKIAIYERDQGCVGPRVGMPGDCFGGLEPDHVRASRGIGMKSESVRSNGVALCSSHHRMKTEEGKRWRPRLIDYLEGNCGHVDPRHDCPACRRRSDPLTLGDVAS